MVPTAVMAARMEPQKAAKKPMVSTMPMPRPPGQWPTRAMVMLTSRDAMPPRSMTMPAKINSGTAISTFLVTAPKET